MGYELGTWTESNVPRVGYIAQILNSYFPTVPAAPAGLSSDAQRAAAVQAAIWYFSDRYVLNTGDPLHNAVAEIVAAVIAAGPLVQPPPPSLTIIPATRSGPAGTAVGPFLVTSTAATTVTAVGADMFADAGATTPIAGGATVASGSNIWLRSTGPATALLAATAVATVPSGNVYLYDGNTSGVNSAQKLILAQTATLRTTVTAQADFQPPGSLVVTKTIAGSAAGQQGQIVIQVTCDGVLIPPPFVIPAGTAAGSISQTYGNLAAGSVCEVVETSDGHLPTVGVRKSGSGTIVTIPPGDTVTANLSDSYEVGSLIVNKTITGRGAGQQGDVIVSVTCGEAVLQNFLIPAGTSAGTTSQTYAEIPEGTVCTATETASGANASVSVVSEGSPQSVTIAANGTGTINISNSYEPLPGSLVVTKTFTGAAAGQQSTVGILVACGAPNNFAYVIPAGTPAGDFPRAFDDIPGGTTCTVTEVVDGSNSAVDVIPVGESQQVVVPPGGTATVNVANAVEALPPIPTTTTTTTIAPTTTTRPAVLPPTGGGSDNTGLVAGVLVALGIAALVVARRRHALQS